MKLRSKISATLILGLAFSQAAFAGPFYVNLLGGAGYLAGSELSSISSDPNTFNLTPDYGNGGYDGTARAALGFYFAQHNAWSYGLEAGYNYFSSVDSNASTLNYDAAINLIPQTASASNSAWSVDLDLVFSQNLTQQWSLIYKLGAAYESMWQQFSTPGYTTSIPAASNNTTSTGAGAVAGFGAQYAFNQNVALHVELDGMKGGENIGYLQALAGLQFIF